MTRNRWTPFACLIVLVFAAGPVTAQQEGEEPDADPQALPENQEAGGNFQEAASLWEDFIHYIRVAQLDLAVRSGEAFLEAGLASDPLLQVVEETGPYRDYDETLRRAQRMEGEISELAERVSDRIDEARIDLAREGGRIRDSILSLDDGLRARLNAQQRLRAAGQYAAPQLLDVLLSTSREDEDVRPYVLETMVFVGRPLVRPLAEALSGLPAVPRQQVAEVLARIGYPLALPYLKAELAREDLDSETRSAIQTAYNRIVERTGIPRDTGADRLFLRLAEDYYRRPAGLVPEPNEPSNLMWVYAPEAGLVFLEIPTPIYHDVMAMRATRRALELNENLSQAMSLWLAANFRRENDLPQNAEDPSYGPEMRSPHFYATLAGPRHLQPVLQRALESNNAELALDAIRALRSTSGTQSLLNVEGNRQPLIDAMVYPDPRVRFEAAFAIARSRPREEFSGAQRVVPVLSEALRVGAQRHALVIAPDTQTINETTQILESAGEYRMLIGDSIGAVSGQIADAPGVDLIVLNTSIPEAREAVADARQNYRLAGTPILVMVESDRVSVVDRMVGENPGVFVTNEGAEREQLTEAVRQAVQSAGSGSLTEEQSFDYALSALNILYDLALAPISPFRAEEAEPALIGALDDPREEIALRAADVLARFSSRNAQQALAETALASDRGEAMRVQFLNDLAQSARLHGNQLADRQLRDLLDIVTNAQGPRADAAAEAHGALNLPTANAVELVTSGEQP